MGIDMIPTGDVEKCGKHGSCDVEKCSGSGVIFRPDGIHELDPCVYETIEKYKNVTVTVSRCRICGHTEIAWERQPDTEEISEEE